MSRASVGLRANRGRRFRRLLVAVTLAFAAIVPAAHAASGSVSGTVFRDYGMDGTRAPTDPGQAGITVRAYDRSNALVGSATSAADGTYRVVYTGAASNGLRLELIIPTSLSFLRESAHGPNSQTSVRFVTGPDTRGVDFGVQDPGEYCQTNPRLVTPCYQFGPAAGNGLPALVSFATDATGDDADGTAPGVQAHPILATFAQVGSINGLAYSRTTNSIYAGAYFKRHVGVGPGGLGAIYQITDPAGPTHAVTPWATLPASAVGVEPPRTSTTPGDGREYLVDSSAFTAPGKLGIGDVEARPDGGLIYAVGLADRRLWRLPTAAPASATSVATPNPCPVPADWRPFGLTYHDGALYLGGVCSAESTQSAADLSAHVYRTTNNGASWTAALSFALDYERRCGNGSNDAIVASTSFVAPTCSPTEERAIWRPWRPATTANFSVYAQPMLTGLAFQGGDLVLGFRDRNGDQQGTATRNIDDTAWERGITAGELLRACPGPTGALALEINGTCGATTTDGNFNLQGPGGGEFYFQDYFPTPHDEIGQGGLFQIPGAAGTMSTALNPLEPTAPSPTDDGGVVTFGNAGATAGAVTRRYRIYDGEFVIPGPPPSNLLGKANGLGDLEGVCRAAPLELGNRVWVDSNRNGLQDAEEAPRAGVTVRLYSPGGALLATAVTAADGTYYFSSAPGTSTASARYGVTGLNPNTTGYTVRLNNSADYAPGGPLAGFAPTGAGRGRATIDSNGILVAPRDVRARVNTGGPGNNNHDIDFGFSAVAGGPPGGPNADLALTKVASRTVAKVGDRVDYTIRIRNRGPSSAAGVRVTDRVPSIVAPSSVTTSRGTCTRNGQSFSCALGTMAAGATATIRVRGRAVAVGTSANLAVVNSRTPDDTPRNNRCCTKATPKHPSTVRVVRVRVPLVKRASRGTVPAGGLVRFGITVRNPTKVTLRSLRVCDDLPAGLSLVRLPRGAVLRSGRVCWTIARLRAGARRHFSLLARAGTPLRARRLRNVATVTGPQIRTRRATASIRVPGRRSRPGGVTG